MASAALHVKRAVHLDFRDLQEAEGRRGLAFRLPCGLIGRRRCNDEQVRRRERRVEIAVIRRHGRDDGVRESAGCIETTGSDETRYVEASPASPLDVAVREGTRHLRWHYLVNHT